MQQTVENKLPIKKKMATRFKLGIILIILGAVDLALGFAYGPANMALETVAILFLFVIPSGLSILTGLTIILVQIFIERKSKLIRTIILVIFFLIFLAITSLLFPRIWKTSTTKFATLVGNANVCNFIPIIFDRVESSNDCIDEVAISKKDPNICKYVSDAYENEHARDRCLENMAISLKDESICAKIDPNSAWGYRGAGGAMTLIDLCYKVIAREKADKAICGMVKNEYDKEECLKYINK